MVSIHNIIKDIQSNLKILQNLFGVTLVVVSTLMMVTDQSRSRLRDLLQNKEDLKKLKKILKPFVHRHIHQQRRTDRVSMINTRQSDPVITRIKVHSIPTVLHQPVHVGRKQVDVEPFDNFFIEKENNSQNNLDVIRKYFPHFNSFEKDVDLQFSFFSTTELTTTRSTSRMKTTKGASTITTTSTTSTTSKPSTPISATTVLHPITPSTTINQYISDSTSNVKLMKPLSNYTESEEILIKESMKIEEIEEDIHSLTTEDSLQIKSDLNKSFSPLNLEDYLLVLPLTFKFLRKESSLEQN